MLSRLPIALAQLKAGNNSEKLKNEIRQLLHSLYRSKTMTKQVYNNLIKYIWIKWKLKILLDHWSHSHSHSQYDFDFDFDFDYFYDYDYWCYSHYNNGDNFYEYWK